MSQGLLLGILADDFGILGLPGSNSENDWGPGGFMDPGPVPGEIRALTEQINRRIRATQHDFWYPPHIGPWN